MNNAIELKNGKDNIYLKNSLIFLSWFIIIFADLITGRLEILGLQYFLRIFIFLGMTIGLLTIIIYSSKIYFFKFAYAIILPFAIRMLISDYLMIIQVVYMTTFTFIIHELARNYPKVLYQQYYNFCVLISIMSIIDFFSYISTGIFVFSQYDSVEIGYGIPRISTVFDEMSHQAFFLMPVTLINLKEKNLIKYLFLFAFLSTFSVTALTIFLPIAYILYRKRFKMNFIFLLIPFSIVVYFGYDFIFSKLSTLFIDKSLMNATFLQNNKTQSASSIFLSYDLLANANFKNLLLGHGFYNSASSLSKYLDNSPLFEYYFYSNIYENPIANGITNLILYFGLIHFILFIYLIKLGYKSCPDKLLYLIVLITFFGSMLHNGHTLLSAPNLFFIFALPWAIKNNSDLKI
jgi:hypothetical protein